MLLGYNNEIKKIKYMTIDEAISVLELHNRWRKGADIEMQSPTSIGMAIDLVVCELKNLRAQQSYQAQLNIDTKEKEEWIRTEVSEYDWGKCGFGDSSIEELLSKGYERGYNDAMKLMAEAIKALRNIAEGLYPSSADEAFIFAGIAKKIADDALNKILNGNNRK